jgi:hypothetical protein
LKQSYRDAQGVRRRRSFSCEDLEVLLSDALLLGYDHKEETLAKLMSEKVGYEIPGTTIRGALAQRCRHLKSQRVISSRTPNAPSFTCEELEPLLLKYRGQKGAKAKMGKALNVTGPAVYYALKTRCKHLQPLA